MTVLPDGCELRQVGLALSEVTGVTLLRRRHGHALYRLARGHRSFILKWFADPAHAGEVRAYALLLEGLATSDEWRLATEADIERAETGAAGLLGCPDRGDAGARTHERWPCQALALARSSPLPATDPHRDRSALSVPRLYERVRGPDSPVPVRAQPSPRAFYQRVVRAPRPPTPLPWGDRELIGGDVSPRGMPSIARRWLALLLLASLAACGERASTPSAGAPPGDSRAGGSAVASVSAIASPIPTAAVTTPVAPSPSATVARGRTAATAGPGSPGGTAAADFLFVSTLFYGGRQYWVVASDVNLPTSAGGRTAPDGTPLRADRRVGKTFARWQTNGEAHVGTEISSVAGAPVGRLLALKLGTATFFFDSDTTGRGTLLDGLQVVLGAVRSVGARRLATPVAGPPDGTPYFPTTIAVERVLHGRIPPDEREIAVHRLLTVNGWGAPNPSVPVTPLVPGSRVILFLYPGRWDTVSALPAGDYYWAPSEWINVVADGRVLPLGAEAGSGEALSLERFEAGVAETFAGVRPLDPHGPAPTPIVLPAAPGGPYPTAPAAPRAPVPTATPR